MACNTVRIHGGTAQILLHDAERPCEWNMLRGLLAAPTAAAGPKWWCQAWPIEEVTHMLYPNGGAHTIVGVTINRELCLPYYS